MDKRLLDILCCPVSRTPVRPASRQELESVNRAAAAGQLATVGGAAYSGRIDEALLTVDRKVLYRIDDGIPVMLPEEGIGTLQVPDFPQG